MRRGPSSGHGRRRRTLNWPQPLPPSKKDESPRQRLSRFEKLLKMHPDADESRMLRAELLIAAEDFPAGAAGLGRSVRNPPDAARIDDHGRH